MTYGPLRHYTNGALDGVVVDPRFGEDATPVQPPGWGGGGGGAANLPLIDVATHGAVGDGREAGAGVNVNAGSTTLTTSATLTPADVGKTIWLSASNGAFHKSTITNHSPKTIATAPTVALTDAVAFIGTDNGAAITAAVNAALAPGKTGVQFGPGTYLTDTVLPPIIRTRDFRISGAGSGGMSFGIYTAGGQPMDRMPGTEILYLGSGTGKVIDASYTRGFRLDNIAVRNAHPDFTGTILELDYTWSSYIDHFVLGGTWYGRGATVVHDTHTVETQFTDGMIERAAIGFDSRTTTLHCNANTYTRVVWLACDIAMIGPRAQAQFVSCVFEPTLAGQGMTSDPLADVSPIRGQLNGVSFFGCGWWDAQQATSGKGWIEPTAGSAGIVISGGYWGPQNANESLIYLTSAVDGVVVHGVYSKGFSHTSGSQVFRFGPSGSVRNLDYRANWLDTMTTSGLDTQTANVAYAPERGFRQTNAHGTVTTTLALRTAGTQTATLGGNVTVTFPTMLSGASMTIDLLVTQDATGGRTLTWPASARHDGGTAPALSTTANATTHLQATTVNGGTTWLVRKVASYAA